MAKRYDPIMCMMVDEPTKAQDAKAKDKLVKVPDSKLKDFEASLRSAGFKVVSKSDRGMTTHYQVEVSSSKKFTKDDLREWANKIDSVCDKMESVAPTTWNIGLTVDGKITAGLDVREMYVKDSASTIDKAIKATDGATGDKLYSDVKAIYNLFSNILLTYTNEQSVQKLANEGTKKCLELAAKVKGVRDEAIKACDASYEYEGTYRGAKIQITAPDNDGTRNVYLDGRALWQDEGPVRKVLSAVQQLIDNQKK